MRVRYVAILVFLFYIWVSGSNTFNFDLDHGGSGSYVSYNHLTDALLHGKLYLPVKPDPKLKELNNPYNPGENFPYRWHDSSYYKDKYYIYFGPTPAVTLYMPFKAITGGTMTDTLACVIFTFGGFIFSVLILLLIVNNYFPRVEKWKLLLSVFVLGFANVSPHLVREYGGLYHVAVDAGFFYLTGGTYFILRGLDKKKGRFYFLVLASLFLGLSVGARPQNLISSGLLLIYSLSQFSKLNFIPQKYLKHLCIFLLPFAFCCLMLGLYNYFRFENPFEFGLKYQLGVLNYYDFKLFNSECFIPNLYFILFQPPQIDARFPYIHLWFPPFPSFLTYPNNYYLELIVGILPTIPFIFLLFTKPILMFFSKKTEYKNIVLENSLFPLREVKILLVPALINFLTLVTYSAVTLRFYGDFISFYIIIAIIMWFYFSENIVHEKYKKYFNKITLVLALYSAIFWFLIGADIIRGRYEKTYVSIERGILKPVSDFIFRNFPNWDSVIHRSNKIQVKLRTSLASSQVDTTSFALDGNPLTSWTENGGKEAVLIVTPEKPIVFNGVWLQSRKTTLYETWKKLNVQFYKNNKLISNQNFNFSDAGKKQIQHAAFTPTESDILYLIFSDPVLEKFDGSRVTADQLNPGYIEILFE